MRRCLSLWVGLIVVWCVTAESVAPSQLAVGAVVAAAVTALVERIRRRRPDEAVIRARRLLRAWRVPVQVARDLWVLTTHLFDPAPGVFRTARYDEIGGDEPEAVGKRAILTAAASIGPNTVVIGWDRERGEVLVHQLVESERMLPVRWERRR